MWKATRLITAQAAKPEPRKVSTESVERRVKQMRERLAKAGEVANSVLRELFPRGLWLEPDDSGRLLWAVFEWGKRLKSRPVW